MNGNTGNIAISKGLVVKPPSSEYEGLPSDERCIVDEYLSEYPVKLGAMANRLGIRVLLSTLRRGVSGEIREAKEDDEYDFVIRINRHESKRRQRFTLAHEIAHYLLHREKIIETGVWEENVLLRSNQSNAYNAIERQADHLASDLIIPSVQLTDVIEKYPDSMTGDEIVDDLAQRFKVSKIAMSIKLGIT